MSELPSAELAEFGREEQRIVQEIALWGIEDAEFGEVRSK